MRAALVLGITGDYYYYCYYGLDVTVVAVVVDINNQLEFML